MARAAGSGSILIVDDEEEVRASIKATLVEHGYSDLLLLDDSSEVLPLMARQRVAVLLLDLVMPNLSGFDLLPKIRARYPDVPAIVATRSTDIQMAIACMKLGAFDYLVKPLDRGKLVNAVDLALRMKRLEQENTALQRHVRQGAIENPEALEGFVYRSDRIHKVLLHIESIAATAQAVLITGETGCGKEVVAAALHRLSGRSGAFVPVNIAGLDDTMLSDTLFGHTAGAFTGASALRKGLVEKAADGTLFLDEIGDLGTPGQLKLLRLIESAEYYPLGSDTPRRGSARLVAATNRDLADEVRKGRFREDLYYRLTTHTVQVPPLRDRPEDIRPLAEMFIAAAAVELGRTRIKVSEEVYDLLGGYSYPGNVRELRSIVYDAVSQSRGDSLTDAAVRSAMGARATVDAPTVSMSVRFGASLPTLREITDLLVAEALKRSNGNQTAAARILGVTPQALSMRLKGRSRK